MPADEKLWKEALDCIYAQRNDPILRAFVADTCLQRDDTVLTLFVHNELVLNILRSRYYTILVEALEKASGVEQLQLDFRVQQPPVEKTHQLALFHANGDRKAAPNLNPSFTFSTFVVGENNRMTHAAALAVSQNPGRTYNPLFIYGGVGLGKTHLLHSIGHCLLEFPAPDFDLAYSTAENFTNEFISSLQEKRMNEFRHKYRACDALLIDDIQFLAQKAETQEAFFHIFNTLIESGRQIVLTSDRSPRELRDIEARLVSRFTAGLITDVQPPDFETRVAILQKKAEKMEASVPPDVTALIAGSFNSNIRELEGALNRVVSCASIMNRPLTVETATEALKGLLSQQRKPLSIESIVRSVSEEFNILLEDINGKTRSKEVVLPRQIAMYLCRNLTQASLPDIGRKIGGRDHTTVLHSVSKIEQLLKENSTLDRRVNGLLNRLKASQ